MLKRIALALLITSSVYAQSSADLQKRLDELKGQIDILTQQIEAIKLGEKQHAAQADVSQYGLGAAASKAYRSEPGVSFVGYGAFRYENPGPGSASHEAVRAVL